MRRIDEHTTQHCIIYSKFVWKYSTLYTVNVLDIMGWGCCPPLETQFVPIWVS